jgi:hypothetical protein
MSNAPTKRKAISGIIMATSMTAEPLARFLSRIITTSDQSFDRINARRNMRVGMYVNGMITSGDRPYEG